MSLHSRYISQLINRKIKDVAMNKNIRCTMTKGVWYFGKSGSGKTCTAFGSKGYCNINTHYIYPCDNGYWDSYQQQDTVVIKDFRADDVRYSELLKLVDKWPHFLKRRYTSPLSFFSNKVIICTTKHPQDLYGAGTDITELLRRFEIIEVIKDDK